MTAMEPIEGSNSVVLVKEAELIKNCTLIGKIKSEEAGMSWSQSTNEAVMVDMRNKAQEIGANRVFLNTGLLITGIAYHCS